VLDLLLPQRCVVCALPGAQVCAACSSSLRRIVPPLCERCGCPAAWPVRRCGECTGRRLAFERARAAVEYDEPVRQVVAAWKERGLRRLARWAAAIMAEAVSQPEASCLVHIPGDPDRRLQRGHHPAERLTRELAAAWGMPFEPLLGRPPGSRRQRGLSRPERRRNVATAFSARGPVPAQVCLVDDVYTTGATVNAAASTLRKAGARRVEVVTFARTIRVR
jgi:ComF family protein